MYIYIYIYTHVYIYIYTCIYIYIYVYNTIAGGRTREARARARSALVDSERRASIFQTRTSVRAPLRRPCLLSGSLSGQVGQKLGFL